MVALITRPAVLLAALAGLALASSASIRITSPHSTSSYHAGDAVPVQWFYQGTGENFRILLRKSGEQVADLCAAETNGVCFDLTQDQTVLLPDSGLESGSDYTVRVKDESSDAEHVSDAFTIISNPDTNIEVTSPDGFTSLSAGQRVTLQWLYVGANELFDIYLRQNGERVSENLCSSEPDSSCRSSTVGSATVTLPAEIEDGSDYRLLVVDRIDDDAWGLSNELPIGVAAASRGGTSSDMSTELKLGLVIGVCAAGVCLVAMMLACCRKRNKNRRREEQLATMDMLNKRRPAPSVSLAVEDMAQPDSPEVERGQLQDSAHGRYYAWLGCCVPRRLRVGSKRAVAADPRAPAEEDSDAITPNEIRSDQPSSPDDNV